MAIVERHRSSNELPDLIVDVTDDDWSIGFDEGSWHTHGDILGAWGYSGSPAEATRQFVDDILASRRQIIVRRMNGKIIGLDVPIEHQVDSREVADGIRKYAPPGETAEIWYWKGEKFAVE